MMAAHDIFRGNLTIGSFVFLNSLILRMGSLLDNMGWYLGKFWRAEVDS
jgi:ABC-type transport system involved in Fe-S cluster assembly fused permease/ATPase subunit